MSSHTVRGNSNTKKMPAATKKFNTAKKSNIATKKTGWYFPANAEEAVAFVAPPPHPLIAMVPRVIHKQPSVRRCVRINKK